MYFTSGDCEFTGDDVDVEEWCWWTCRAGDDIVFNRSGVNGGNVAVVER